MDQIVGRNSALQQESIWEGWVGQSYQERYVLRASTGNFIAFYCRYRVPASKIPWRNSKETTLENVEFAKDCTPEEITAAEVWLAAVKIDSDRTFDHSSR